jgi:hypothetical protein
MKLYEAGLPIFDRIRLKASQGKNGNDLTCPPAEAAPSIKIPSTIVSLLICILFLVDFIGFSVL